MNMTTVDYLYAVNAFAGYCSACDKVTQENGVEPDADGYECPRCEAHTLMGVENAMIVGKVRIVDAD